MTPHRTAREQATARNAAAAVARAQAHAGLPGPEPEDDPTAAYPITPDIARAIRHRIKTERTNP